MDWLLESLGAVIRVSMPLLFAALGGLMSERSGVVNIALEGFMLMGAFAAAALTVWLHSPWIGFLGAGLIGAVFALVYALFTVRFRSDQIVAGTAINFLALGLTPFLSKIFFGSSGSTPSLPVTERLNYEPIFVLALIVGLIVWWMRKTPSGLWLQFAGEHPKALASSGISVNKVRWAAVAASGVLAGLGGATLSIALSSAFSKNMTSGRGFLALAALILGKWKPIPTVLACLFFGLVSVFQIRLQGADIITATGFPVQLVQILPYLLTLLVIGGWIGRSRPPSSLGVPFRGE